MAARAVVRRGDHRLVAGSLDHAGHGPRVELRAIGQHDERVRHLVAERCRDRSAAMLPARPPTGRSGRTSTREPRSNLVRAPRPLRPRRSETRPLRPAPPGRPAGTRAASGRRTGSQRRRLARPRRRSSNSDGGSLELDDLRRLLGRRIPELADPPHDRSAGGDRAEHRVVRRQAGVRSRDDEELAATRPGRFVRPSPSRPFRTCSAYRRAACRRSCSRGRRPRLQWGRRPGSRSRERCGGRPSCRRSRSARARRTTRSSRATS